MDIVGDREAELRGAHPAAVAGEAAVRTDEVGRALAFMPIASSITRGVYFAWVYIALWAGRKIRKFELFINIKSKKIKREPKERK